MFLTTAAWRSCSSFSILYLDLSPLASIEYSLGKIARFFVVHLG
jgi:hypothetical protein